MGQALQYIKNQQPGLMAYIEDGNCEIPNNLAENSIRPFTVGGKNWLFAGNPKGATANAIVYSLMKRQKLMT
ncbi:IS66 family transposase [Schnuerera ultunensis]|uniref:IS66 family transposase n=1 Tax=Schnuerera ultunensis TaxID=45497 RepID=UPI0038B63DC5